MGLFVAGLGKACIGTYSGLKCKKQTTVEKQNSGDARVAKKQKSKEAKKQKSSKAEKQRSQEAKKQRSKRAKEQSNAIKNQREKVILKISNHPVYIYIYIYLYIYICTYILSRMCVNIYISNHYIYIIAYIS